MMSVIEHFNLGGGENQHFRGCTKYHQFSLNYDGKGVSQLLFQFLSCSFKCTLNLFKEGPSFDKKN